MIKSYDEIMEDMLSRIGNDVDKEQGSVIWDALSPAAIELTEMYIKLQDVYKLIFIRTSEGEHLTELCFQYGIHRLPANKAIRACTLNIDLPIGTRFSVENSPLNFALIEKGKLKCETAGTEGNRVEGRLLPIDYIEGLQSSLIGPVIILGEDTETDESLRDRTLIHITRPQQDGNVDQYLKWASEFVGIGNATVLPLWNGPNTVKVIITDAEGNTASNELVANFQTFLDPGVKGFGEGKAPIGAFVKVESAKAQKVDLNLVLDIIDGYPLESIIATARKIVLEYMKEATREKIFKKYEVQKRIDDLDGVQVVRSVSGQDLILLEPTSVFTLGLFEVTKNG